MLKEITIVDYIFKSVSVQDIQNACKTFSEVQKKTWTIMQLDHLQLCTFGSNVLHIKYGPVHETEDYDIIKTSTSFIVHRIS